MSSPRRLHSALLASLLRESWRADPPPLEVSVGALAGWVNPLIESGAGALVWRKLRGTALAESEAAHSLQQTHRLQVLDRALGERFIAATLDELRAAGIEALLIKGWSSARLYPERGLRPLGDLDLHIRPADSARAAALMGVGVDSAEDAGEIDFKTRFSDHYEMAPATVWERSQQVLLQRNANSAPTPVRVLCPEDHLRALCVHFLKHGAWRPLWLCDIAVALESRPSDFSWELCLRGTPRSAGWVLTALALAHRLLGARIEDTPAAARSFRLPAWLVPAVLRQWEQPTAAHNEGFELMSNTLRNALSRPSRLIGEAGSLTRALLKRWPDPIMLAIEGRLPLDDAPRLPRQIRLYVRNGAGFVRRSKGRDAGEAEPHRRK